MRRHTLTIALPGEIPGEFLIFPFGAIETTKGVFFFDADGAEQLLETWRDYGNVANKKPRKGIATKKPQARFCA